MFFRYPDIPDGSLSDEKMDLAAKIAAGLADAEIVEVRRRFLRLTVNGFDAPLEADITPSGLTIYLGGFDWVTYPTPQHILQHFPEYLPLPQQVFRNTDEDV